RGPDARRAFALRLPPSDTRLSARNGDEVDRRVGRTHRWARARADRTGSLGGDHAARRLAAAARRALGFRVGDGTHGRSRGHRALVAAPAGLLAARPALGLERAPRWCRPHRHRPMGPALRALVSLARARARARRRAPRAFARASYATRSGAGARAPAF